MGAWKKYEVYGQWVDPNGSPETITVKARSPVEAMMKAEGMENDDGLVFDPQDAEALQ